MSEKMGLYIHTPFCVQKCPYCDFYSLARPTPLGLDDYVAAVEREMTRLHARYPAPADTLYFGGGTPSLLGGERIARLITHARRLWGLSEAEITLEANPGDDLTDLLTDFAAAGGNRLSLGMQATTDAELAALGRRHTHFQTRQGVEAAHRAGITNLSLDVMLGIPCQTTATAIHAVEEAAALGATHLSAYLLKIEEGTPFFARKESLSLPDEEELATRYLAVVEAAERVGLAQYEISNFAAAGCESRHNRKYWDGVDYLGIGPSAHSFVGGRRWYYPRDLAGFLAGNPPLPEDPEDETIPDGSPVEYLMLRLRLTAGLTEAGYAARYGEAIPAVWRKRAAALPADWVVVDEGGIRLTPAGFLLSNPLIARIAGL